MAPGKPESELHGTGLGLSEATDWAAVKFAREYRTATTEDPAPVEPTA